MNKETKSWKKIQVLHVQLKNAVTTQTAAITAHSLRLKSAHMKKTLQNVNVQIVNLLS